MASKHLLFLVHGMGEFPEGWSRDVQGTLEKAYKQYPQIKFIAFSRRFQCHEIRYDDEFQALRRLWSEQAQGLGDFIAGQGITDEILRRLNRLGELIDKDTFVTTHIVDVLLYRFARQTASAVRDSVRRQILDVLAGQDGSQGLTWSVIAHSLGTSVIHDALHGLYSDTALAARGSLGAVTRPRAVVMVANVSRVLQSDVRVYHSLVRPGAPDDQHVARHFVNCRHEWDPFPAPRAFRPKPDWPSAEIREQGLFRQVDTNAIEQLNVHGFTHYLRNPKVHAAIFNALLDRELIDGPTVEGAHRAFVESTPQGRFESLVDELKEFQLGEEDDFERVIERWAKFRRRVMDLGLDL